MAWVKNKLVNYHVEEVRSTGRKKGRASLEGEKSVRNIIVDKLLEKKVVVPFSRRKGPDHGNSKFGGKKGRQKGKTGRLEQSYFKRGWGGGRQEVYVSLEDRELSP